MRYLLAAFVVMAASSIALADKAFTSGKGAATWDCKTDPVVAITGSSGTYTFKGECKSINLTGGHTTMTIESVDTLDIIGASNTVSVDTVDTININGAANKITWKKGKSGAKPTVSQLGQNNAITQKP